VIQIISLIQDLVYSSDHWIILLESALPLTDVCILLSTWCFSLQAILFLYHFTNSNLPSHLSCCNTVIFPESGQSL